MDTKAVLFTRATVAVWAALLVTGCDRVKAVVETFEKKGESKSAKAVVQAKFSDDQISDVTAVSYADFISRRDALVVVDFHADWLNPCRELNLVLEKAAEAHPGVVYLGKVNVDYAPDFAAAQKVDRIPDVRIFKNGKEVDRFVGFPGESRVLDKIADLSKGITPAAAKPRAEPVIQPFQKDWMPPGMRRKNSATR